MTVLQTATDNSVSQTELLSRIQTMGNVAVAKKVPAWAVLL